MSRVRILLTRIHTSLWFVPALITAAAVVLAFLTVWIDRRGGLIPPEAWFIFGAGAEGARGVLATIAGSIITVTGVVFSITIVVLQLASSQFTPRVLQHFTQDRANQLVLGVFIGTFTYALLVLRTVRSELEDRGSFVPAFSVTIALLLALVSMGFLIYFINHVSRSIQAEVVIDRAAKNALHVLNELFPGPFGDADECADSLPQLEAAGSLESVGAGYIQGIDEARLVELAESQGATIVLHKSVGDFVLEGDTLLRLEPRERLPEAEAALRKAITLGPERTRYQDLERALVELTDIGIRALSPGVNDPTTAIVAIDRLTEVISVLAKRRIPRAARAGGDGVERVFTPRRSFAEFIQRMYRPLAHHAAPDPQVTAHLGEALLLLLERVAPARRSPISEELRRLSFGRDIPAVAPDRRHG